MEVNPTVTGFDPRATLAPKSKRRSENSRLTASVAILSMPAYLLGLCRHSCFWGF